MERKVLLIFLVVVGLAFATYVVAQTFNAPTVDEGNSELEIIETRGGVDGTTAIPAEMEKIDTDGDGMSDWFEENYSHTDPKVSNDRYLLYIDAVGGKRTDCSEKMLETFIREYKFAPENTIIIENTTFADFTKAVDKIAEKADENDFVYVQISAHGDGGPRREFEVIETKIIDWGDGTTREVGTKIRMKKEWKEIEPFMDFFTETGRDHYRVEYKEIGEILDKIKCQKMLVSYSSCAGNTAVEPLNKTLNRNPEYPRVIMGVTSISYGIGKYVTTAPVIGIIRIEKQLYQKINDSYLSMKEYYRYDKNNYDDILEQELAKIQEAIEKGTILDRSEGDPFIDIHTTKIADPYNIAETFYFGEAKVKDLYKPRGK